MADLIRFSARVERPWAAPTGGGALVDVPPDAIAALGGLKQMRVIGTLNGLAFKSSTMPAGGGRAVRGRAQGHAAGRGRLLWRSGRGGDPARRPAARAGAAARAGRGVPSRSCPA